MTMAATLRITERNEGTAGFSNDPSTDFHFFWTSYWKELHGTEFKIWGEWLAQSEGHVTLDLRIISSSPTLGTEPI